MFKTSNRVLPQLNTASLFNLGSPCGSAGKESTCNAGDLGSIPGLVRSPVEKGKARERFTENGPAHQNKNQFPRQSVSPIRKLP